MSQSQRVTVIGGTDGTGHEIVQRLLRADYHVRVMSRHPDEARDDLDDRIEVVEGDLTEPATLRAAVRDTDHLILTAGLPRRPIARGRAKVMLYDGTRALLQAAQHAKLPGRFLYMSALGTTKPSLPGVLLNLLKGGTLHWRRHVERDIRSSGLDYCVIHAGILNDEPPGQHAIELSQHNYPLALRYKISRADVAEVFVRALSHPNARNATFDAVWTQGDATQNWDALFEGLQPDAQGGKR